MQPLDRPGNFRGRIDSYGLYESDSGAVAVNLRLLIDAKYESEDSEWNEAWKDSECFVDGSVWIVKKDGTLNEKQVDSLVKHAGWDGDLSSIQNGTWEPEPVAVVVNEDNYNGKQRMRIAFVNGYDSTPGGQMGALPPDRLQELESRFGRELRALAGNANRNKPNGNGSGPLKPTKPQTVPAGAGDDIPF